MRAVCFIALAACQSGTSSKPPEAAPGVPKITARDPAGKTVSELQVANGHCAGAGVDLAAGAADPLAGRYRIGRAPGHVDIIDAQGMPLAHVVIEPDLATVNDPGRAPVAKAKVNGDRVEVATPDGAALAYVTGTTDLEVAALLTAPGVPDDVRATLACQKLLSP